MDHKERTRHRIAVMQAYVDGKPIQYKGLSGHWFDHDLPTWDWKEFEYRIEPEVIVYRRALWRASCTPNQRASVIVCTRKEQESEDRTKWAGFIRWIDTDWIKQDV